MRAPILIALLILSSTTARLPAQTAEQKKQFDDAVRQQQEEVNARPKKIKAMRLERDKLFAAGQTAQADELNMKLLENTKNLAHSESPYTPVFQDIEFGVLKSQGPARDLALEGLCAMYLWKNSDAKVKALFNKQKGNPAMATALEKVQRQSLENLRGTVQLYYGDKQGEYPKKLPGNGGEFKGKVPPDLFTLSNKEHAVFNGKGGWVYDKRSGTVSLNIPGVDSKGLPYKDW